MARPEPQVPRDLGLNDAEAALAELLGDDPDAGDALAATGPESVQREASSEDVAPEAEGEGITDEVAEPDVEDEGLEVLEDEADEGEESDDSSHLEYEMPDLLEVRESDDGAEFGMEIDGEFLPLDELRNSYFRQSDYSRKTEDLSQERRAVAQEREQLAEARERYASRLAAVEQAITAQLPEEPDWEDLAQSDPAAYNRERARWDQVQRKLDAVRSEQERVQAEQQQHAQVQMAEKAEAEHERLLEAVPEWRDASTREAEVSEIMDTAISTYNATPEELAGVADHRILLMMRDAHRYHQLVQSGETVTREAKRKTPTLKPGRPPTKREKVTRKQAVLKKHRKRLTQTGKVDDASALIERMLAQE